MTKEDYARQMIQQLREEFERAAKPYFDMLVEAESLRPAPRLVLTREQASDLIEIDDAQIAALRADKS